MVRLLSLLPGPLSFPISLQLYVIVLSFYHVVECSLAQKVTESTHKMLSELDYAPNRLSASDILFGPQYQMTHDSRILWTVTRGHMLWSLWSVRAFSRSNDSPEREINIFFSFIQFKEREINIFRLESPMQYSFLNS